MNHNPFKIVCICGSMKFRCEQERMAVLETLKGNVVIGPSVNLNLSQHQSYIRLAGFEQNRLDGTLKEKLDALHLVKIYLSNEILVVDIDNYTGESTKREIDFALQIGRHVRYWSDEYGSK